MDQEARISELEARIAELTELVRGQHQPDGQEVAVDEAKSSRRGMLKLAGAAAVGAVASTVGARQAAATTDEALVTGHLNSATQQTAIRYGGTVNGGSGVSLGPNLNAGSNAMLKLDAALSPSTSTPGIEVIGRGTGANISSESSYGASITGTTGILTFGSEDYGVLAFGGEYAVASALSSKANLYLQPNNNFILSTSPKTPPLQRTDAHIVGEIDNVAGDLWMCVAAGTPGTWRKLTGPTAAGSLHLLPPKRVYDSRPADPPLDIAPKIPLPATATRTIDCTLNASGVPAAARGLLLNVGVVSASGAGFLSVTPGGTGFTGTSVQNWNGAGVAIANGVTVGAGPGATIDVYAGAGATDFFVDVFGYYI